MNPWNIGVFSVNRSGRRFALHPILHPPDGFGGRALVMLRKVPRQMPLPPRPKLIGVQGDIDSRGGATWSVPTWPIGAAVDNSSFNVGRIDLLGRGGLFRASRLCT